MGRVFNKNKLKLTNDDGSVIITPPGGLQADILIANGFVDTSKVTMTYDESTRVLTVTIASGAVYWSNGFKYTPTAGSYPLAAHADTTGTYWVYYRDASLTMGTPDIEQDALIGYVHYNATTNEGILFDERHPGDSWPSSVHKYAHDTRGAVLESGGVIADYTLDTFADYFYSISSCEFDDESIEHSLDSLAANGPYSIWYRSGTDTNGEWSWNDNISSPVLDDGDDIYYNDLSGGTWALTAVTNNYYVNYWLFGTNAYNDGGVNYRSRFIQIPGEEQYQFLASALGEDVNTDITWGDHMPFVEIVPLYRLTYRCPNNGAGKDIKLMNVTRIAGQSLSVTAAANPTIHNALSGRSDAGAHPADAISYDNVASGMTATDVQAAIEELEARITALEP